MSVLNVPWAASPSPATGWKQSSANHFFTQFSKSLRHKSVISRLKNQHHLALPITSSLESFAKCLNLLNNLKYIPA